MTSTRNNPSQLSENAMQSAICHLSSAICHLSHLRRAAGRLALLLLSLLPGVALGQSPVSFADPNLEAAVRSALAKPAGELTSTDLLSLTSLEASHRAISSLAGLESALNLSYLNLEDNLVEDVTPLAGLTALQTLYLDNNRLTRADALGGLTNLTTLLLDNNSIHDVRWLAGLWRLGNLGLMFNPLADAAVLAGLTNLTELHVNGTSISDVSFLRGMPNLTTLGLGDNNIQDGSPLGGLTRLQFLGLGANPISNWDFMTRLTELRQLYLFSDSLTDVSFLAGLRNLTWLRLADNQIRDAAPLAGLSQLQYLDLNWNQLANVDFAHGLTAMTNLTVSYNRLTDLHGLLGAVGLRSVALSNNPLDLTAGSPAANVVQTLQSRGVAVDVTVETDTNTPPPVYVASNGTYNGLIYPVGALTPSNSGCITLTTTTARKYTGKLQFGGKTYPLSGILGTNGIDSKTIKRGKQPVLLVTLILQETNYLTGTVSMAGQGSSADIVGYRAVVDGKSLFSPQAGRYTLVIAGTNSLALPAGNGWGTFTVSTAGKLRFAGALADGTKLTQSASVSWDGRWPFYTPLYSGKGLVLGWMAFTNAQSLGGELAWIKPKDRNKPYPAGFAWVSQAEGARYSPPGKGTNAFGLTACDLTLKLSGGELKQDLATQFTLNARNQAKALPNGSQFSLTLTPATGLFKGRAVDPETHKVVSFNGVILQNQTNGWGYFLGTSTSGQVLLGE